MMLALMTSIPTISQSAETSAANKDSQQKSAGYSLCQSLSDRFKLFDAKRDHAENPWIQEFRLKWRAQYQIGYVQPAGGSDRLAGGREHGRHTNSEWRRFRIGGEAKVFKNLKLFSTWDIGGLETRDTYSKGWRQGHSSASVYDMYVSGKFKPVTFTLGKFKPAFMGEYRTSDAKLITIERSFLVNQLKPESNYGIAFANSDKKASWGWEAGVWVNGYHDNMWMEPAWNRDSGYMFGGSLSYATSNSSRLYLDYMHTLTDWDDVKRAEKEGIGYQGAGAQDIVSLTWEAKQGKLNLMAEAIAGFNVNMADAENVCGFVLMPSYRLTPHWEGVFRYQLSSGSNAVKSDSRYYTTNSTYKNGCDLTQAFYVGANYYVCPENPHAMKVMFGAEYVNSHGLTAAGQKGFTGWGFTSAFRLDF